jgi:hypothetical protein
LTTSAQIFNKNQKDKMKLTDQSLIAELERLAEACPWDSVDLWITREPEGRYGFTAYIRDNPKLGMPSMFGYGHTPAEAVDGALRSCKTRDPEIARRKKIEELRLHIEQLQAVVIGLPPYRPGRQLGNGEPCIEVPQTVDV